MCFIGGAGVATAFFAAAAAADSAAMMDRNEDGMIIPDTTVSAILKEGGLGFFSDVCNRTSRQKGEASAGLVQPVHPCHPPGLAKVGRKGSTQCPVAVAVSVVVVYDLESPTKKDLSSSSTTEEAVLYVRQRS